MSINIIQNIKKPTNPKLLVAFQKMYASSHLKNTVAHIWFSLNFDFISTYLQKFKMQFFFLFGINSNWNYKAFSFRLECRTTLQLLIWIHQHPILETSIQNTTFAALFSRYERISGQTYGLTISITWSIKDLPMNWLYNHFKSTYKFLPILILFPIAGKC